MGRLVLLPQTPLPTVGLASRHVIGFLLHPKSLLVPGLLLAASVGADVCQALVISTLTALSVDVTDISFLPKMGGEKPYFH